jgi:hypothetical protein
MTQKKGQFSVVNERSAVTEQMSLLQADRSRFEDQQPEKLGCRLWKAAMVAHEGGEFQRIMEIDGQDDQRCGQTVQGHAGRFREGPCTSERRPCM